MRRLVRKHNKKGQATIELAILGIIVIMLLSYLLQQGFMYNARQSLEMYTFRQALKMSRDGMYNAKHGKNLPVGVNLTVIRDVIVPSFFTGLNRQSLIASASVDYNPYILYIPKKEDPEDVSTRQLIQMNEAMIRNNYFIEVPPMLVKVDEGDWMWTSSNVSEIDFQTQDKITRYTYLTDIDETRWGKTISKSLESKDTLVTVIKFEQAEEVEEGYKEGDESIGTVLVGEDGLGNVPQNVNLTLDEIIRRTKSVTTEH